jgi:hypothetical protein
MWVHEKVSLPISGVPPLGKTVDKMHAFKGALIFLKLSSAFDSSLLRFVTYFLPRLHCFSYYRWPFVYMPWHFSGLMKVEAVQITRK